MTKKIKSLQSFRGLACLTIVISHFSTNSFLAQNSLVANSNYMVMFFFTLSGFVISHSYSEKLHNLKLLGDFTFKRFRRLWPLHFTILLIYVFFEIVKHFFIEYSSYTTTNNTPAFAGQTSIKNLIESIFLIHALFENKFPWNGPSWSISTEFYTYLIFGLIMFIYKKKSFFVLAFIFIFYALIEARHLIDINYINEFKKFVDSSPDSVICHHLSCRWNFINFNRFTGNNLAGFSTISRLFAETIFAFSLGAITNLIYKKISHFNVHEIFGWLFLVLSIYLVSLTGGSVIFLISKTTVLIVVFSILILLSSLLDNNSFYGKVLNLSFFQFIGKISYSLYMIHALIAYLFFNFLRILVKVDVTLTEENTAAHFNFTQTEATLYTLIYIFISIVSSWILYEHVENRFRAK